MSALCAAAAPPAAPIGRSKTFAPSTTSVRTPPAGTTPEQVNAMIALSYGITYIWGTVGIILICKYLPTGVAAEDVVEAAEVRQVRHVGGGLRRRRDPGGRAASVRVDRDRVRDPSLGERTLDSGGARCAHDLAAGDRQYRHPVPAWRWGGSHRIVRARRARRNLPLG